jgi:hypothetical protein
LDLVGFLAWKLDSFVTRRVRGNAGEVEHHAERRPAFADRFSRPIFEGEDVDHPLDILPADSVASVVAQKSVDVVEGRAVLNSGRVANVLP